MTEAIQIVVSGAPRPPVQVQQVVAAPPRVVQVVESGPQGPRGGQGAEGDPGISDVAFTYRGNENSASAVWLIVHPLPFRPNVSIVDSAGTEVIGDVTYVDDRTIRCEFSGAFAGIAYLS